MPKTPLLRGSRAALAVTVALSARRLRRAYAVQVLRQFTTSLTFETRGRGLLEITRPVVDWTADAALKVTSAPKANIRAPTTM